MLPLPLPRSHFPPQSGRLERVLKSTVRLPWVEKGLKQHFGS